jgi:hypothetical protein
LPIADSKVLYSAGDSWEQLELGLHAALTVALRSCQRWQEVWQALAADEMPRMAAEPGHAGMELILPSAATPERVEANAQHFAGGLRQAGVSLMAMVSRPVFAGEFNRLLVQYENKSTVLSHVTLGLVRQLTRLMDIDGPLLVYCDKHGGRNHYAGLLQHFFSDHFIEVHREGRAESVYRFGAKPRRVEFRFCAGGEAFLPTALASMACKYLRELSMHAFNRFWAEHVPGIKPTAGYPDDARRFRREIAQAQAKLGMADEGLWRMR